MKRSCFMCGTQNLCWDCAAMGKCHLDALFEEAFATLGPNRFLDRE